MSSFVKFTCGKMRERENKNSEDGTLKANEFTKLIPKIRLKSNQHYLEEIKLNWLNKSCGSKLRKDVR